VSTLTRWTRAEHPLDEVTEARLRATLSSAFARRRRTILGNLRAALPGGEAEARRVLEATGIDGGARPEAVSPASYLALASVWRW